ncbi:MAG: DUF4230 domain-containing protein [Atopobiaceae bacterium]|jgi:hypothetical protein|nr:DUF4230 domain-containing protein [Atopobiaceae bacterium]MCH4181016.1 DUF4230 domain-containing protein [Atopobiaceae bacterium]MCH4214928.1 DUF4230 domain-containing protein [Atopobiaceae bacterium]MCH4229744.1 DUF4230 domain-containing protein [Atopobiaceae bacterium]MCH4276059.1 DUF4230 domain-containing protein [Atopobiaceae bacterium]
MKRIARAIVAIVVVAALFGGGFWAGMTYQADKGGRLASSATIQEQISGISELATAKLDYRGLVRYEDGDIQFINKKAFTMLYTAELKAGVDLSQATVEVSGRTITVTLPEATVLSESIDPNSLSFYDQSYSLFNWENKQDTQNALELAQDDVEEKADTTTLISTADQQAKDAITSLLEPLTTQDDPYTIVFK